jgi:hypothetical protein
MLLAQHDVGYIHPNMVIPIKILKTNVHLAILYIVLL